MPIGAHADVSATARLTLVAIVLVAGRRAGGSRRIARTDDRATHGGHGGRPTTCSRRAPSEILADVAAAHAAVEGIQP